MVLDGGGGMCVVVLSCGVCGDVAVVGCVAFVVLESVGAGGGFDICKYDDVAVIGVVFVADVHYDGGVVVWVCI